MVGIVADTSFLIAMANRPVRGIERIESLLGRAEFLIPAAVVKELERIAESAGMKRSREARTALRMIESAGFRIIDTEEHARASHPADSMSISRVDDLIVRYAEMTGCYVATIDKEMMRRLRGRCAGIITLQDDTLLIV